MSVFVTKADGSRQLFDKEKIIKTCLRMGANKRIAFEIAEKVEKGIYNGISTDRILQTLFRLLRKYKPVIRHLRDLRKGLSLMEPKPEFERFVQVLLMHSGFEVSPNRLISGKCVEHEVDAIAKKDEITYFVEAKHHSNYHTPTGLDETRIARAVLEDVSEGFNLGKNNLKIDGAMIVTNTRYSEHAKRYGKCRNILQIGWSSPANFSLQNMIEKRKLHPIACLVGLRSETRKRLLASGIVLLKQLVEEEPSKFAGRTGISYKTLKNIIDEAKICTETLWKS